MELITLKTFQNSIDAHILMSRLEDEGIRCYLHDDNISTTAPFLNRVDGGIKLKINNLDYEKAQIILNEINDSHNFAEDNKVCPTCNSSKINSVSDSENESPFFITLLKSIANYFSSNHNKLKYRCADCGTEFKN